MKARVFGVSVLLDENNNSDGHHKFELLLDDVYTNMIVNDLEIVGAFELLLDKYWLGEEFDFSELDGFQGDKAWEIKK